MRICALLVMVLASFSSFAATKVNLFDVESVVYEQQANAKQSGEELARRSGMREVIVRATGDSASLDNPVVKKAITQSSRFLSTISPSSKNGQPTLLMSFNPRQIQALLQQANLPYWPPERAKVLVWIVEDNGYDRTISWEQSGRTSVANLNYVAHQKGLPVVVPVGDIDDVTSIKATELWGGFGEQISKASRRYHTDSVVVVRIERNGSKQKLRWTLYDDKAQYIADPSLAKVTGQFSGTSKQVTEALVAELGRYYANKSTAKSGGKIASSIVVNFDGIETAKDFFTVEKMLQGLASVASVELDKVTGNSVDFRINLITDQDDFQRQLLRSKQVNKGQAPQPVLPVIKTPEVTTNGTVPESVPSSESADAAPSQQLSTESEPELGPSSQDTVDEEQELYFDWN
ncbi:DUF2066 domain-containing protein [Vibrio gallicus]|uniref:DUF2066 domain-containing protein n=1 Tax=Vibrio gallicus TaxID=190897 RepID=UPI0021C26967|nr:DUF2066 domain-containing protein [Vibrio gallicus]